MTADRLGPEFLDRLDTPETDAALAWLQAQGLQLPETAVELCEAALARAEAAPQSAGHWLAVAAALNQVTGDSLAVRARIRYAQARLDLQRGALAAAEEGLRQAQALWQQVGDRTALARSYLGLTQVLALQGRYAEAEVAIQAAISGLPAASLQAAQARLNLANLLRRQERHAEALAEYTAARQILVDLTPVTAEQREPYLVDMLARVATSQANAFMYLDLPGEAEEALVEAVSLFSHIGEAVGRGQARTNLGSLYVRTGRYAQALEALNQAAADLLDDGPAETTDPARLRQADVLLLEQANAYLALNLLPEATAALERAVILFRVAQRPYELGQSLYTLGLLHLRSGDLVAARPALLEAEQHFAGLQNGYWQNRVAVAMAALAHRQGNADQAADRLDPLLNAASTASAAGLPTHWDVGTLADACLLRLQCYLDDGAPAAARRMAQRMAELLDAGEPEAGDLPSLPHLRLRLHHALGCIAVAEGNPSAARPYFYRAIDLLERQRAGLLLEEVKAAYLDDKADIYSDLLLSLLAEPAEEPATTAVPEGVEEAFAVVEQARSRILLERLLAAVSESAGEDAQQARRSELRRRLHWLYNQLLGEEGGRRLSLRANRQLQDLEAALQRLEWQDGPLFAQAQPAELRTFQQVLAPDQQALVYYVAQPSAVFQTGTGSSLERGEVLVFVLDRERIRLVRRLCSPAALASLADELSFQLGRAELGREYIARHAIRLESALQAVLTNLYQALVAPAEPYLTASRLLLVPHGLLHQLPFHGFWDGEQYLLERFECSYAPSASIAVHCQTDGSAGPARAYASLAGLAIADPAIPQARHEVAGAARHFSPSWLYLDDQASRAGLEQAAGQADILHVATHGLFRPDNPFFSSLKLADGWIDVREIYRLRLSARLVVLSACESGMGRVRGGDEVVGLARGFLGAGARSLLVSLWNVHDASAARLMETFYQRLLRLRRPAAALRAAQRAAIQAGEHPYFWAPFLAIG